LLTSSAVYDQTPRKIADSRCDNTHSRRYLRSARKAKRGDERYRRASRLCAPAH
jgi:hypothetical protein